MRRSSGSSFHVLFPAHKSNYVSCPEQTDTRSVGGIILGDKYVLKDYQWSGVGSETNSLLI